MSLFMENPDTQGKPAITGKITFDPRSVELYRDEFVRRGTLTAEQGEAVTSVLAEKGPQEAIQKLVAFLGDLEK